MPNIEQSHEADQLESLSSAIVEDRAVLYVGSGASAAAGLPGWRGLLERLFQTGAKELLVAEPGSYKYLGDQIKAGNFIEAADLLQDVLDNDLERLLWEIVQPKTNPTSVHVNAARIPFQLAMTTNYDLLLEKAHSELPLQPCLPVLTWEDPHAILTALRTNRRAILKLHGAIGNGPSLILSTRQYRSLMFGSPLFRDIFEWIFTTKTCLFIGASLTDVDLLQTIHSAIARLGEAFGPHYALLPADEAPPARVRNLMRSLRIHAIALKANSNDGAKLTGEVSRVLIDLGSKVAAKTVQRRPPPLPASDEPGFFLNRALDDLLASALRTTGSFRADVCLSSDAIGSHLSGELTYARSVGPTAENIRDTPVHGLSVCGMAYYSSEGGVYVPNVLNRAEAYYVKPVENGRWERILNVLHHVEYVKGHTNVQSELAIPITAEGVRVGILNLESDQLCAYSDGHFTAARWFADKAGRLFTGAIEREHRGSILANNKVKFFYERLRKMFEVVWAFRRRTVPDGGKLALLVYHVNYVDGVIRAQDAVSTVLENKQEEQAGHQKTLYPQFTFEQKSLATAAFTTGHARFCADAPKAASKGDIPEIYVKELGISGPILGFSVWIGGYIAGVITMWESGEKKQGLSWRDMELFRRTAHAVANGAPALSLEGEPKIKELEGDKFAEVSAQNVQKHIREVLDIVSLFNQNDAREATKGPCNLELLEYWAGAAKAIARLLIAFRNYWEYQDRFLVPKRARLWIRSSAGRVDRSCALVAEISIPEKKDSKTLEPAEDSIFLRNLFEDKCIRIAVPGIQGEGASGNHPSQGSENLPEERELGVYADPEYHGNLQKPHACFIGLDDRYLTFHLSRLNADRFTRLQWPGVLGIDPNAHVLDKNDKQPWYVAPILAVRDRPMPGIDQGPPNEQLTLVDQERMSESVEPKAGSIRTFVGYITLDDGHTQRHFPTPSSEFRRKKKQRTGGTGSKNRPLRPEEAALQNELLHKIDLFTGCLAETEKFRRILKELDSHTAVSESGQSAPSTR